MLKHEGYGGRQDTDVGRIQRQAGYKQGGYRERQDAEVGRLQEGRIQR
jgi:hypothetical protein